MAHVFLTLGFIIICGGVCFTQKDCYSKKDCKGITYDTHEAVCCEKCLHPGAGLACCGKHPYNPAEAACCTEDHGPGLTAEVTPGLSQSISSCCGLKAYDSLNEICCGSTIIAKPSGNAKCCEGVAFDANTHLCCGRNSEKRVQTRLSTHHQCCGGQGQYDTETQCCCWVDNGFEPQPKNSQCCKKLDTAVCGQSGTYNTQDQLCCNSTVVDKPTPQTKCCGGGTFDADTELCCGPIGKKIPMKRASAHHRCCGQGQYDLETECCCEVDEALQIRPIGSECSEQLGSGHPDVCCKYGRRPSNDQFCGGTPGIFSQGRVFCCNQSLHKDREFGNKCHRSHVHLHSAAGTVCCSRFHGSPGEHCCGTELYQPQEEICCSGHRYRRVGNVHCCGVKAYNIRNKQMKCCAGRLHELSKQSAHEAQCCGSLLLQTPSVCCRSEDEEVLYSPKQGFSCCGHRYFNTSLWSCCEGRLCPARQHHSNRVKEFGLVSLNNLGEDDLCREMHAGILDSVSPHTIVFSSVVKFNGSLATMEHLPSTYILTKPDGCNFPKLIPGKTYFFNQVNVSIDFNHDSILQSLYFIFSKCSPRGS